MGAKRAISFALPVLTRAVPPLGTVTQALGVMNQLTGVRGQKMSGRHEREMRALELRNAAGRQAYDREIRAEEARKAESQRLLSLRRSVARQRARFGSQGVGSDGSSQAVLLGMFEESEAERVERERIDGVRGRAADAGYAQAQARNLLIATQESEKEKLKRYYFWD